MTRILLVDDHAVVRRGVRQVLAEEMGGSLEFGEAGTPAEALALVEAQPWDLVLLDISLPGRGGLDTLRELKRLRPALPVLVLSMHAEEQYAVRTLRAGASGYVRKDSAPAELVRAARKVLAGGTHVSEAVADALARAVSTAAGRPLHEALSDRELEVLRRLAVGRTVKEIAGELHLSEKTISTYRTRLLRKMNMRTNAELTQYALRVGLVE